MVQYNTFSYNMLQNLNYTLHNAFIKKNFNHVEKNYILFTFDICFQKTVMIIIVVGVKQDQKTRIILHTIRQMSELYP